MILAKLFLESSYGSFRFSTLIKFRISLSFSDFHRPYRYKYCLKRSMRSYVFIRLSLSFKRSSLSSYMLFVRVCNEVNSIFQYRVSRDIFFTSQSKELIRCWIRKYSDRSADSSVLVSSALLLLRVSNRSLKLNIGLVLSTTADLFSLRDETSVFREDESCFTTLRSVSLVLTSFRCLT